MELPTWLVNVLARWLPAIEAAEMLQQIQALQIGLAADSPAKRGVLNLLGAMARGGGPAPGPPESPAERDVEKATIFFQSIGVKVESA